MKHNRRQAERKKYEGADVVKERKDCSLIYQPRIIIIFLLWNALKKKQKKNPDVRTTVSHSNAIISTLIDKYISLRHLKSTMH